jgi:uroporphyrinogen III methyltransferase/synthase
MLRPSLFQRLPEMKPGLVYLIGAGPGDPGLITVRGRDCLRSAEVVVYDYLANPLLLREAPEAEKIYVGKSKGLHHLPQEEINALLVDLARQGKVVARLKGGDPYVFGRGGEEALCLAQAGIPFEVIPGVTAAFAAGAYAGIPLTHRDYTTSLGLFTGHEDPAKKLSTLDWEKLATGVGTLVFYMGMSNLDTIARELIKHGRGPQTPVAVIRWATLPRQETLVAPLNEIAAAVTAANFKPPAIIIVGEVVSLRQELSWFDRKPLFGRTILVTRAAEQAGEFTTILQELGAQVVECPTIHLAPVQDPTELDAAIAELASFSWLILTSGNAVRFFFARLAALGLDARALGRCRVCAVGPKTAAALGAVGIHPDLVPADYKAEGVVEALAPRLQSGEKILFPRADKARDVIVSVLSVRGAEVRAPVLYCNTLPAALPLDALAALEAGGIDAICFTASSTVENLHAILGAADFHRLLTPLTIASIGPITSRSCTQLGLPVAIEPAEYTLHALAAALVSHYSHKD